MTHISERNKWSMALGVVMTLREGAQCSRGIITPFVCHRSKTEMWEVQDSAQNRRSEAWLMSKAEIDEAWLKSGGVQDTVNNVRSSEKWETQLKTYKKYQGSTLKYFFTQQFDPLIWSHNLLNWSGTLHHKHILFWKLDIVNLTIPKTTYQTRSRKQRH